MLSAALNFKINEHASWKIFYVDDSVIFLIQ